MNLLTADGPFRICLEKDGTRIDDNEVLYQMQKDVLLLLGANQDYQLVAASSDHQRELPQDVGTKRHT